MTGALPPAMTIPAADYRRYQNVMPGVEGLYNSTRAIFDAELCDKARILIAGAGGGRELEALAASPRGYSLVGVDPSPDMKAIAASYVDAVGAWDRVELVDGYCDDIPEQPLFDAATAILVMHFLPDDGAKAAFLHEIRKRLKLGAQYLHADACFGGRTDFDRLAAAVHQHALIVGLPPEVAEAPAHHIGRMAFEASPPTVISPERTMELFEAAGFRMVSPFFRGLWYAGWWLEAA